MTPKTVVGNIGSTKGCLVTHDAAQIFGSIWNTKMIDGTVTTSERQNLEGATWNATFITVEWELP